MHNRIEKYCAPTRFDKEPQGSIWRHKTDADKDLILYVQTSSNLEAPEWITLGDLLAKTMQDKVFDAKFMKSQIEIYQQGTDS
jgi:hypothetical protein